MNGPVEHAKIFFNKDKAIYTKDFPVRKDSFHCETFHVFLPILNRFLHFHIDNLFALSLVNPETFSLHHMPKSRQQLGRWLPTTMKYRRWKKKKKDVRRERNILTPHLKLQHYLDILVTLLHVL